MSGIIGGAGSKSGVIGTTELDYEEGTWTPIGAGSATWGNGYGQYVKIGKMVWCSGVITCTSISGGTTNDNISYPFTSVAGTGAPTNWSLAGVGTGTETVNTGYTVQARINNANTVGALRQHNNGNTWAVNDRINFTVIYEVA